MIGLLLRERFSELQDIDISKQLELFDISDKSVHSYLNESGLNKEMKESQKILKYVKR